VESGQGETPTFNRVFLLETLTGIDSNNFRPLDLAAKDQSGGEPFYGRRESVSREQNPIQLIRSLGQAKASST
jgi:hypothetical protein